MHDTVVLLTVFGPVDRRSKADVERVSLRCSRLGTRHRLRLSKEKYLAGDTDEWVGRILFERKTILRNRLRQRQLARDLSLVLSSCIAAGSPTKGAANDARS